MIEISKREGQFLNQIVPHYIYNTVHKRHYYMTECSEAYWYLNRFRENKKFVKYNPKKRTNFNRVKE